MNENKKKSIDNVEKTLAQLAHLSLGVGDVFEGPSSQQQPSVPAVVVTQLPPKAKEINFLVRKPKCFLQSSRFNSSRHPNQYRPYMLRKQNASSSCAHNSYSPHASVNIVKKLSHIKLGKIEDIEELKLSLLLSLNTNNRSTSSCSIEASRYSPVDEGVAGEVAELAEYFSRFVAMKLKMSPLAESMYV
ncbi:unnamed protein product [Anisakis simplex]|uniref:Oxidative stress-responsive serine-rich protein 1 n=1 Tax=Anisakis simplex TaxID=6269 RepID=A0A0M3K0J0_ANISI|nr:unnamed protein product [Anisakis simplex]